MSTLSLTKVRAYVSAAVLGMAALTATSVAQAQVQRIKVNVPFAFEDGSAHLAAGSYIISMNSSGLLLIRGDSHSALAMVRPEETLNASPNSKVVFRHYGDRYFLREVWTAGSTTHMQLPKSRSERRLQIASANTTKPEGEEVALLEIPR